jgi:hypothetical protein
MRSLSSSPDTQRMLVSYPPDLESAAAPVTAFATSSWPRSGCEMVSRPTAMVRRSSPTIWLWRRSLRGRTMWREQIAEQFTLGLLGQVICDALLAEQLARKLAGVAVAGHTADTIDFQQRREVIDHRIRRERIIRSSDVCEVASAKLSSEPPLGSLKAR